MSKSKALVVTAFLSACIGAQAQNAPNVSQVLMWSTVTGNLGLTPAPGVTPLFTPTATGNLPNAVLSIYTEQNNGDLVTINTPSTYKVANLAGPLNSAISANIGVALSLVPIASPASAVVWQKDPVTGANLPGSSNALGPIFTERADVIGKGNFHLGITHQNFHFTKIDGLKLNGISILYPGGDNSPGLKANTVPATFNMALDIRLSQDLASLTYGLTNRVDVSVGLPMVHSAVSSTAYNGLIYGGAGDGTANGQCWCINTFTPGAFNLKQSVIGQAGGSKTGFGDLLIRAKAAVVVKPSAVLSIGGDVRFPTGDAENYLGSGTTTVKPFAALSLYSKPVAGGLILSPHVSAGWQFAGKSVLAGQFQSTTGSAQIGGTTVSYATAPFRVPAKGTLPDVFSWAAGVELALGKRNTIVLDVLGDQIGWINGIPRVKNTTMTGLLPTVPGATASQATFSGLSTSFGTSSFGQYSGAFGYKARVAGNLVATFNMLVRLDNNGLTSRLVPLFGLSYAIGN